MLKTKLPAPSAVGTAVRSLALGIHTHKARMYQCMSCGYLMFFMISHGQGIKKGATLTDENTREINRRDLNKFNFSKEITFLPSRVDEALNVN